MCGGSRSGARVGIGGLGRLPRERDLLVVRSFRGKKALITGAGSGIGRAIAMALAEEGANIWLIDRDEAALALSARDAARFGTEVRTTVCDLADPHEITAGVGQLLSTWGSLNILVNSAGIAQYGPMHLIRGDDWDRLIAVNLLAPIQLVREFFATLAAEDEAHILNVCSYVGLVPHKRISAYQTSKFGLVGYTLGLRADYNRHGFGVTALCPGFVDTPLLRQLDKPAARGTSGSPPAWICTTPEHVAQRALASMRRNRGLVIVTPVARLAWWLARLSPGLLDWLNRDGWRRRGKVPVEELRMLEEERTRAARHGPGG